MKRLLSVFLGKILGNKLYDRESNPIGTIIDIAAVNDEQPPRITAFHVKRNDGTSSELGFDYIDIYEQDSGKLHISCNTITEYKGDGMIYLSKDLLDKQIVDINGRKVVRVNDLRIAEFNGSFKLIAVDIGFTGLLRRLGIDALAAKAAGIFNKSLCDNLITWDNVEPLKPGTNKLTLSIPYKKAV